MRLKWLIIGLCSVVIVGGVMMLFFNKSKQHNQKIEDLIQIAIYPTGTTNETYYFVLNRNGMLKCSFGSRKNDDIKQQNFLKEIVSSSEKLLDENDVQILLDFADELEVSSFNEDKRIVTDSWNVALLYKEKVYEMNLHINDSEILNKLVVKVVELSPIPVDLHDWA